MAVKRSGNGPDAGLEEAPPHYHGHRERLRARFREAGSDAVTVSLTGASGREHGGLGGDRQGDEARHRPAAAQRVT